MLYNEEVNPYERNIMDYLEELIENSDKVVVNYIQPKYTPKEQLVSYAIGAVVGLACVGVIVGTSALVDAVGTALYNRRRRLDQDKKKNLTPVKD